ncbi:MAG: hypothetical protein JF597_16165 [Streptomyces sp.]|uniref:hypothetical protein n=1 Tax=Streptomyces sp. TaxID=1931 RepID=UPI0025E300A9|nr:hypothetical protein [Streptomyces sp.]MBW8795072.1 hypothetical protein [Streptomyces sp.]
MSSANPGKVIGSLHRRHRAAEFKKFLIKLDIVQGTDGAFGAVVVSHGIADHLAGGQVQPAGEVEPAL